MKDFFIRLLTKKSALIAVPVKEYVQSFIQQKKNLLSKPHISYRIKIKRS